MDQPTRARTMDGAAVARRVLEATTVRAVEVTRVLGRRPCLAAVLVGDDPASVTYVRMKQKRCESVGVDSRIIQLAHSSATSQVVATIRALSDDKRIDGILLQHPVPDHMDERAAFEAIAPAKDVDGVTIPSFAAMAFGLPGFWSCTPGGIMRLLDEYSVDPCG